MKNFPLIRNLACVGGLVGTLIGTVIISNFATNYIVPWHVMNYQPRLSIFLFSIVVICLSVGVLIGIFCAIFYLAYVKQNKVKTVVTASPSPSSIKPEKEALLSEQAAKHQEAHEKKVAYEEDVSDASFEDPEPVDKHPGKKLAETPATIFSHSEKESPEKPTLDDDSYPKKMLGLYVPKPFPKP